MNFFQMLNPKAVPPFLDKENEILILKERTLQTILLGLSIVAFFLYPYYLITNLQTQTWLSIIIYSIAFIIILIDSIVRNLSYKHRVYGLVIDLLLMGSFMVLQNALYGYGIAILFMIPLFAAIFIHSNFARITILFTSLMLFSVEWFISTEDPLLHSLLQVRSIANPHWVLSSILFTVLSILCVHAILKLFSDIIAYTENQRLLVGELRNKRSMLEERLKTDTLNYEMRINLLNHSTQYTEQIKQIADFYDLLQKTTEFLCTRFGLDFAGIYVVNETKEMADLQAFFHKSGESAAIHNRSISIDDESMLGHAIKNGEPRISPDILQDTHGNKNELLSGTVSQMILPISIGKDVFAAIDLQSNQPGKLSLDAFAAINPIINQLAVMMDKITTILEAGSRLEELDASYRQLTKMNWQQYLQNSRTKFAFRFKENKIESNIQETQESLQAYKLKNAVHVTKKSPTEEKSISSISMPIRSRNEVLGVINIQFDKEVVPDETKKLLSDVIDRLSIALDNARLLEEIQMSSERDHLVTEIATKIRSETTMDNILRIAAVEIGRSLGVSDVVVQLKSTSDSQI